MINLCESNSTKRHESCDGVMFCHCHEMMLIIWQPQCPDISITEQHLGWTGMQHPAFSLPAGSAFTDTGTPQVPFWPGILYVTAVIRNSGDPKLSKGSVLLFSEFTSQPALHFIHTRLFITKTILLAGLTENLHIDESSDISVCAFSREWTMLFVGRMGDIAEDETTFYSNAEDYWKEVPPTVDGMLGGYGSISSIDINGSKAFLQKFLGVRNSLNVTLR